MTNGMMSNLEQTAILDVVDKGKKSMVSIILFTNPLIIMIILNVGQWAARCWRLAGERSRRQ